MALLRFEFEVPDFEDWKSNALAKAHKAAGTAAVSGGLAERIDDRFTGAVQSELGWRARDARYQRVKLRVKKRSMLMNFSGGSRARARGSVSAGNAVFVTKKRMGIRLRNMPKQFRRGFSRKKDLHGEIRRLTRGELRGMQRIYPAEFVKFMNTNPAARRKVKRRIG